jgi:hypothetical protein
MAMTSLMPVGNSADSPEPLLKLSPAAGRAEIRDEDLDLGYDTEKFPY